MTAAVYDHVSDMPTLGDTSSVASFTAASSTASTAITHTLTDHDRAWTRTMITLETAEGLLLRPQAPSAEDWNKIWQNRAQLGLDDIDPNSWDVAKVEGVPNGSEYKVRVQAETPVAVSARVDNQPVLLRTFLKRPDGTIRAEKPSFKSVSERSDRPLVIEGFQESRVRGQMGVVEHAKAFKFQHKAFHYRDRDFPPLGDTEFLEDDTGLDEPEVPPEDLLGGVIVVKVHELKEVPVRRRAEAAASGGSTSEQRRQLYTSTRSLTDCRTVLGQDVRTETSIGERPTDQPLETRRELGDLVFARVILYDR